MLWPTFITVAASIHLFPRNNNIDVRYRPGEAYAYQTSFAFRGRREESGTTKAFQTCSMATAIPYGMLGPRPRLYIKPDDCYSISPSTNDTRCRLLCSTLHWSGADFNCYQAQMDGYYKQDFFPLLCRVDGTPARCVGEDCVIGSPNRGNGCFDYVMANIGGMCKTADCYEDPYFRSKVSCFVQGHDDLTTSTTTPTKITTTTPTTKETTTEIATTTPKTTTEIATTTPKTTTEETTTTPKTTTEETTTTPKTTKETTTTPKTTTEETTTTPEATTTSLPPPTTTTTTAQTHTEAAKDIGSGTVAIGGAVGAVTTFSIYTCCGGIDLLGVVDNGGEAADLLSSDNGAAGDGMRDFVRTSLLQRAASG